MTNIWGLVGGLNFWPVALLRLLYLNHLWIQKKHPFCLDPTTTLGSLRSLQCSTFLQKLPEAECTCHPMSPNVIPEDSWVDFQIIQILNSKTRLDKSEMSWTPSSHWRLTSFWKRPAVAGSVGLQRRMCTSMKRVTCKAKVRSARLLAKSACWISQWSSRL